jgi:threonine dehydrogenase-like Zn-dependent dehydrogenase
VKALLFERNVPRFAASRLAAGLAGTGRGVSVGPLRLTELEPPPLPSPGWHRVRPRLAGICGSDIATLDGRSSRYFEPIVSFPFVPGHEIVGDVDGGPLDGRRVVVEPVLGCLVRGIDPCEACASGRKGACAHLAFGHLRPGLQTGYCADTGGGWSDLLVAHESQLHEVPAEMSDEAAVMIEPIACAVHAVLSAAGGAVDGAHVVVLGAGTLGLGVVAALRHYTLPAEILAVAKHPDQRTLARSLGADVVLAPSEVKRGVRRHTGAAGVSAGGADGRVERLTGGADVVFDCVGSADSLEECLAVTRPGGRIVLVGMPGRVTVDLAPLWQREISLVGAYAYGAEERPEGSVSTFSLAADLVASAGLERLVSASYPLDCFPEAVEHAARAGRRGAVKIVFDMRRSPRRASSGSGAHAQAAGDSDTSGQQPTEGAKS